MHKLHTSTKDKYFAGVCGGLAETTGIDVSIIRLLFFISIFLEAPACWFISVSGSFFHGKMLIQSLSMFPGRGTQKQGLSPVGRAHDRRSLHGLGRLPQVGCQLGAHYFRHPGI